MYSTSLRLAQSVSTKPLNLRNASAQLYPPIPFVFNFAPSYKLIGLSANVPPCSLYRRLLRAHRNLPLDMRTLGDEYVKSEYRRHRSTTNPLHIIGFLSQWKVYLEQLPTSKDGGVFKGKKLDTAVFEKMSSEQIAQLYELMHVSKDVWRPVLQDNDRRPSDNT